MKLKITLLALVFTSFFYGQTTAIPDTNFEQALVDLNIDSNGMNGNILNSDAQAVTDLNLSSKSISNLSGIEAFLNLRILRIQNNILSALNLTSNTLLEALNANFNVMSSLNLPNSINLRELLLAGNNLNSIDLSNSTSLLHLDLAGNRFVSFNTNDLPNLKILNISNNQPGFKLTNLNVQNSSQLTNLTIASNSLSVLNLTNNTLLKTLIVADNQLSGILDVSSMSDLLTLQARYNNFTAVNLANGNNSSLGTVQLNNNSMLTCIQVDDVSYANAQSQWIKDATASYSTACSTLGLDDKNINLDFKLYPNPTFNTVNIETPHTIRSLKLTNISGQVIFETKTALNKMDLTVYNAGIYFISIETDKGVSTKKIIKQ